jgi:hypothetical protein
MTNEDRMNQKQADKIFDNLDVSARDQLATEGASSNDRVELGYEVCAWLESRARSWRCARLTAAGL